MGVLGGVGAVAGRGAVLLPGPGSWPGVAFSVLLSIVAALAVPDAGGPGLLAVVVAGPLFRLPGCWRRCLASSVAVIASAGGPAAAGVLFLFGTLPQVHSQVSGVPGQVFAALTRRGLVWSCDSTTKRVFPVSKKLKKSKKVSCNREKLYQK